MANFYITTDVSSGQSLATGEYGFVTQDSSIYTTGPGVSAVAMAGASRLTVLGDVVSQSGNGIFLNSVANTVVNIGQDATVFAGLANTYSGVGGTVNGTFTMNNEGSIGGFAGLGLSLTGAAARATVLNSGHIFATANAGGSAGVNIQMIAGSKAWLDNSGRIDGNGFSDAVRITGEGSFGLTNSGTISPVSQSGRAIASQVTLRLDNSGMIGGTVSSVGATILNNSGTIAGDVFLGANDDTVRITGVVDGSIFLGDGFNSFRLDKGASVGGFVRGGYSSDTYVIRDQVGTIEDMGGMDSLLTAVDMNIAYGMEMTTVIGPNGLRLVGTDFAEGVAGGKGGDTILGEVGNDTIWGGGGDDLLVGGEGNDHLYAERGDDQVRGNAGDDVFYVTSGGGLDTLQGGSGQDHLILHDLEASNWSAVINLATGEGRLNGETILSLSGIESVTGSGGADSLTGDAQANRLNGYKGNDTILGGAGNDTIAGGEGADLLVGGSGADVFRFDLPGDSNLTKGQDTIQGFSVGADIIDLSKLDPLLTLEDDAFAFIGTAAFSGSGPQVRFQIDTASHTTQVEVRYDLSTSTEMMLITLDSEVALTAANFLL